MTPNIGILALGAANGKSVACALERAGAYAFFIDRASDLRAIDGLVIPGVANFGYVADSLDRLALRDPVRTALEDGLPALGICVGFQILFEGSEEAPNAKGLGCFPGASWPRMRSEVAAHGMEYRTNEWRFGPRAQRVGVLCARVRAAVRCTGHDRAHCLRQCNVRQREPNLAHDRSTVSSRAQRRVRGGTSFPFCR